VPYALAAVLMLVSYASDRSGRRRVFVWPFLLVGTGAFYASYAVGRGDFGLSFVLLIIAGGAMYAPDGPYFALIPELLPADVAGAAMGAINAFGALGGFAGAYVVGVLGGGTSSGAAFIFMAGALFVAALLMFFVRRPRAVVPDVAEAKPVVADPVRNRSARWVPTHVGAVSVPRSALHSGRLKTH